MKGLPDFREVTLDYAERYAQQVFGDALHAVAAQAGGYFRATFGEGYFTIQPGNDAPSRSQWNTLKKRMKRVNRGAFVLKETGTTAAGDDVHYYVDFGFLREDR
jgi:hypothetical protein